MHHPAPRSGLARAGEILLLVGSIIRIVGAFFVVVVAIAVLFVGRALAVGPDQGPPVALAAIIYIGFALLFAASAVIGFIGWNKARAGQYRTPGILGIVVAMLPPLDVVFLLGGIFLLVCDEAKAEEAAAKSAAHAAADAAGRDDP